MQFEEEPSLPIAEREKKSGGVELLWEDKTEIRENLATTQSNQRGD